MIGVASSAIVLLPGSAFAQLSKSESDQIHLQAAPPPASSDSDIVVTAGPPPKASAVTKQAESITRSDDVMTEPLARYETPLCPGIVGFPREIAELIVDRIRYDAERIGARLASDNGCRANLLVVVTHNGQAEVKALVRSRGYLFANMSQDDVRALAKDDGPVHAWNNITRHGRHGETMQTDDQTWGHPVQTLYEPSAHSKIFLTTRLEIDSGVVLLDVTGIDGLSVNQIADYVVMRGLVDTRAPSTAGAMPTILTLFDPNSAQPLELTEFDLAYLKRTYSSIANLPGYAKLAGVGSDVRKATAESKPAATAAPAPNQSK
jgi:hypothetical protein